MLPLYREPPAVNLCSFKLHGMLTFKTKALCVVSTVQLVKPLLLWLIQHYLFFGRNSQYISLLRPCPLTISMAKPIKTVELPYSIRRGPKVATMPLVIHNFGGGHIYTNKWFLGKESIKPGTCCSWCTPGLIKFTVCSYIHIFIILGLVS